MGQRILILSRTPIGKQMSSPGIRYVNLRRVLQEALPDATVTLASPEGFRAASSDDVGVVFYDPMKVGGLIRQYDAVIGMSFPVIVSALSPFYRRPLLILDFFSQFHLEWLEVGRDLFTGLHRRIWTAAGREYINLQLLVSDFITCANERQRDSFIGVLASLGLLTHRTYEQDPTLRRLIDVVPHGVRPEPFPKGRGGVKGTFPGIEKGDKLLLWLGGILYWYDTVSLLRALHRAREKHPELKLLFLGTRYPGIWTFGQGVRFEETVAEAKRLGLWNNGVYMQQEWLSQEALVPFLQDADAAVTTYFENGETRFAHRTRFQDYIWARLPIVCTEGDVLAEMVQKRGWGVALPQRDEEAIYRTLMRIAEDDSFLKKCRANLEAASSEMSWESAFEPLVQFLRHQPKPEAIAEPRGRRVVQIMRSMATYLSLRLLERMQGSLQQRFTGKL